VNQIGTMDAERKLVDVAVVAHNEQAQIERCLDSLLNQSAYAEIRSIVVIDNCSTDSTADRIVRFFKSHADVKWSFYQTNKNALGDSRNFALNQVDGSRWICYVDADSVLPVDWLASHIENYQTLEVQYPNLCAVGGGNRLPQRGLLEKIINIALGSFFGHGGSAQGQIPGIAEEKNHIPTANGMFKVSALKQVGGVASMQVGEDFDLGVRLRRAGFKLFLCPKPTCENDCIDNLWGWFRRMFRFSHFGGAYSLAKGHFHLPVLAGILYPVGVVASLFWPSLFFVYLAVLLVESIYLTGLKQAYLVIPVTGLLMITHLSYSVGTWAGISQWLTGQHPLFLADQHKPFEARLVTVVEV